MAKNAGIIADEVARITKIIHQVLNFSRPRGPTLTRVQLPSVVAEALAFVGETIARLRASPSTWATRRRRPRCRAIPIRSSRCA